MLNTIKHNLPDDISRGVETELQAWKADNKVARIWTKDATVWTDDDEANWLGWLDIVASERANVGRYRDLHADIQAAGFTDVCLMGMGGSSLCPEVLAMTFGKANFHILDSTDPAQIIALEKKLDLEKTIFIVASKSGSTLEPNCFKQYFFEKVAEKFGREHAGRQFIAITDPGSKMERVAQEDGFRHIFYGKPEIGGRFSALSAFGMTAAAAMGLDVEDLLRRSAEMVTACKTDDPASNPGALLGTVLGVCHAHGRDKLTILTSPAIHDLGAWLEQLIAESTGKKGVAIIPVDREPVLSSSFSWPAAEEKPPNGGTQNAAGPSDYSSDRIFAFLSLAGDTGFDTFAADLNAAGHPTVTIALDGIENLGQEFFRWEFATAVAGSIMKINPFNQPDVEAAKIEARKITDKYEQEGKLPDETPFFEGDGFRFFGDPVLSSSFSWPSADDEPPKGGTQNAAEILNAFIDGDVGPGDYFATLAYIEMNARNTELVQTIREKVLERKKVATCVGFGPRFLHSTGQAYKGGGNNGVFLQITCDDAADLQVPGQKYTFGIVKAAQARGDLQVLQDRHRRTLRIHLGPDVAAGLEKLVEMI